MRSVRTRRHLFFDASRDGASMRKCHAVGATQLESRNATSLYSIVGRHRILASDRPCTPMSERNVTGPQTLIHNLRFGPLPIINYITLCGLFCGCFLFLSFISGCKFATLLSSSNAVVSIRRRMKAALKSRFPCFRLLQTRFV
jgi:hypothetical protein